MRKQGVSMHRQAVLLQDVMSFREYIKEYMHPIWRRYLQHGFSYDEMLEFIIRELIWRNTQCVVENHHSSRYPYYNIFSELMYAMQHPTLEDVFRRLIKVPIVYGDVELYVMLGGRDLIIAYYIPQPLSFQ